jgi:hypothetical protein
MYKLWDSKKQAELNKKSQQEKELEEKIKEELFKRQEKKQIAEKSFKKWKESKDYDLQQKMSEQAKQMKAIKQAKQEVDKKKRDAEKQYQIWLAFGNFIDRLVFCLNWKSKNSFAIVCLGKQKKKRNSKKNLPKAIIPRTKRTS